MPVYILGLKEVRCVSSSVTDIYASLAERIKHDLEALNHDVWFDLDRLKAGGDWERYIEQGLEFASAIPGAGRFLLLMTPHSVRRPDGYCLNEIARALGRDLPVIPVMVSDVEPPLSICRLQWLDMRRCFPAQDHEQQYTQHFEQLVNTLQQKQVPFEGVQQRLLNYLQPISYGDDLRRHLSRFTAPKQTISPSSAQNRKSIGFSSFQEQISGSSTERVGSMVLGSFP